MKSNVWHVLTSVVATAVVAGCNPSSSSNDTAAAETAHRAMKGSCDRMATYAEIKKYGSQQACSSEFMNKQR